jgi:hypothetical protein
MNACKQGERGDSAVGWTSQRRRSGADALKEEGGKAVGWQLNFRAVLLAVAAVRIHSVRHVVLLAHPSAATRAVVCQRGPSQCLGSSRRTVQSSSSSWHPPCRWGRGEGSATAQGARKGIK